MRKRELRADGGVKLALCAPAAQDPASGLELHHPLRPAALALAFGRGQRISVRGGKDRETRVLTPEYILHNESRLLRRSRFFYNEDTERGECLEEIIMVSDRAGLVALPVGLQRTSISLLAIIMALTARWRRHTKPAR